MFFFKGGELGREADNLLLSGAEIKYIQSYASISGIPRNFSEGVQQNKLRTEGREDGVWGQ
jgi:hypothetical protein